MLVDPTKACHASHMELCGMPQLIAAIGGDDFEMQLQSFLWELCRADHYGVFRIGRIESSLVAADPTDLGRERLALYKSREMWRVDPMLKQAMQTHEGVGPYLVQMNETQDVDPRFLELFYSTIRARYFLYGRHANGNYALSFLRSSDVKAAPSVGIAEVKANSQVLLSVLAKHYEIVSERQHQSTALSSLSEIESRVLLYGELPRREASVCGRLIYGMMNAGIAIDLGVSEESVKTYRKRLYRRLNITSARELLVWYLSLGPGSNASSSRKAVGMARVAPASAL